MGPARASGWGVREPLPNRERKHIQKLRSERVECEVKETSGVGRASEEC
jgi:hypothetical protein